VVKAQTWPLLLDRGKRCYFTAFASKHVADECSFLLTFPNERMRGQGKVSYLLLRYPREVIE
jgi:hypothetical protein